MIKSRKPEYTATKLIEIAGIHYFEMIFRHPDTSCPVNNPGHTLYTKKRYSSGTNVVDALKKFGKKNKQIPTCNTCSKKYTFSHGTIPTAASHPVSM